MIRDQLRQRQKIRFAAKDCPTRTDVEVMLEQRVNTRLKRILQGLEDGDRYRDRYGSELRQYSERENKSWRLNPRLGQRNSKRLTQSLREAGPSIATNLTSSLFQSTMLEDDPDSPFLQKRERLNLSTLVPSTHNAISLNL